MLPSPLFGLRPAAAQVGAVLLEDLGGRTSRTTCPKMIGSETFIMVALRWTENSTPSALAPADLLGAGTRRARPTCIAVASTTSPASTGTASLSTVAVPSSPTSSIRSVSSAARITAEFSLRAEVVGGHGGDVGPRVGDQAPIECGCVRAYCLHRRRRPAVGVALAQHRVDGAALDPVVAGPDVALLVGPGLVGVGGQRVALRLQLGDGGLELRHRGGDVRQLDDVGRRRLRQRAQLGQVVGVPLVLGQPVGERRR